MATRNASRRGSVCLAASALLFVGLAGAVISGTSDGLDAAARSGVNGWASPALTDAFMAVTRLGSLTVVSILTALATAALLILDLRRDALRLVGIMVAACIVNNAVKLAVARARPQAFFGDVPPTYSFASGHALYAACFFCAVGVLIAARLPQVWQRAAVLASAITLIGAVGVSRVYLGVHYPTDVAAGFALAAMLLSAAYVLLPNENHSRT